MTEYASIEAVRAQGRGKRGNKYGAVKTVVEDIKFDSKLEAERYQELAILQRAGKLRCLYRQVTYFLRVNGMLVGKYTPDFVYIDEDGTTHTEDVKGVRTRDLGLRLKLMKAIYGIDVELWPARKRKAGKRRKKEVRDE